LSEPSAQPPSDRPPGGRPSPSRRTLALLVGPIIAVVTVGTLGNAFHAPLLRDHPLLLVAMEPRLRYLLLVAEKLPLLPFLLVATLRRLSSDPCFYLIGHFYGDRGVRWIERKMGESGGLLRAIERWFPKLAPGLVFVFPGALVCVLAGATGMSFPVFLALNVLGTVTVVTVIYNFAELVDGPIGAVNRFYSNNTVTITVISVLLTAYWLWDQRRRGRSEIESISTIEKELEGEDDSD
jgi:membrane protein DedA with SNARE-associated domain